jgi:hypothetical protein
MSFFTDLCYYSFNAFHFTNFYVGIWYGKINILFYKETNNSLRRIKKRQLINPFIPVCHLVDDMQITKLVGQN